MSSLRGMKQSPKFQQSAIISSLRKNKDCFVPRNDDVLWVKTLQKEMTKPLLFNLAMTTFFGLKLELGKWAILLLIRYKIYTYCPKLSFIRAVVSIILAIFSPSSVKKVGKTNPSKISKTSDAEILNQP
jgi:hypothetical protein